MIEKAIFDTADGLGIGEVYWSRPPEGTVATPYVVLDPPASAQDEYDSAHVGTEILRLRFHVFASSLQAARTHLKSIEAAFVFGDIGVEDDDGALIQIIKVADDVSVDPEPDENGDVWHGVLDLDAMIARTPGQ